jgi:hypothetical protein
MGLLQLEQCEVGFMMPRNVPCFSMPAAKNWLCAIVAQFAFLHASFAQAPSDISRNAKVAPVPYEEATRQLQEREATRDKAVSPLVRSDSNQGLRTPPQAQVLGTIPPPPGGGRGTTP